MSIIVGVFLLQRYFKSEKLYVYALRDFNYILQALELQKKKKSWSLKGEKQLHLDLVTNRWALVSFADR